MIEVTLSNRQVNNMLAALSVMANRVLPDIKADLRVGRCIRVLKPFHEKYREDALVIQKRHTLGDEKTKEGEGTVFQDFVGMQKEMSDLLNEVQEVTLPDPITEAMLPKATKTRPDNDEGVAGFLADLGPLYEIPEDA